MAWSGSLYSLLIEVVRKAITSSHEEHCSLPSLPSFLLVEEMMEMEDIEIPREEETGMEFSIVDDGGGQREVRGVGDGGLD